MLRGLLLGGFVGVVVSGVGLVAVSLVTEPPAGSRPPLAPVVEPPGMAPGSGDIASAPAAAVPGGSVDQGGAPAPSDTPVVARPAADADLPRTDAQAPQAPVVAQEAGGLSPPDTAGASPGVTTAEAPVLTVPLVRPPEAPVSEAALNLPQPVSPLPPGDVPPTAPQSGEVAPQVVAPVQTADTGLPAATPEALAAAPRPEAVDIVEADPAARPAAAQQILTERQVAALSNAAPVVPGTVTGREVATAPALGPPAIDELLPSTGSAPEALPEVVEIVPDAGASGADAVPGLLPETAPPPESDAGPDAGASAEPETEPDAADDTAPPVAAGPRIALSGDSPSLPGRDSGVRVTRPGAAEEAASEPVAEAVEQAPPTDGPALVRYAATYDNPEGKPLMSIVLIDDGQLGAGALPAVQSVPFAVTVALDATAPEAAARMATYRAAGIEVMALADLPEGAVPSDADVTLEAAFATLPEAVGLLDAGTGGLQADRGVTEQAMARLSRDGRGFLTVSQGLNMALRSAEAADVPAAVIYRDLDGEDQDARVIRRFLDQAAFRARQQSGVVMIGRVRPDTLSALTLWGTANRAGQVTLAPVSAVLGQ